MNPSAVRMIRRHFVLLAGLAAIHASATTPARSQERTSGSSPTPAPVSDWDFSVRPYLFLSGVSGSIAADPLTFPINSSFGDVVDHLQIGAFLAFTAEKGKWGTYTDFQYIRLLGEGTTDREFATLTLENLFFEADVTLRPTAAPSLRFLGGARIYSIDQTLSLQNGTRYEANTTVVDPILGALGKWELGRWGFEMRGDIGGFGISSEFTYQLLMLFHPHLSDTITMPIGYRVLGYQIKADDVEMSTRMGGLVLGLDVVW